MRVYRYRLLPPIQGAEIVAQQMSLAHSYSHRLTEIELARRDRYATTMATHSGVQPAQAALDGVLAELEALRAGMRAERSESRARSETDESRLKACELRAQAKLARAALREAKRAAREDPTIRAELEASNARAAKERRSARAQWSADGLYWGSYLLIEAAAQQAAGGAAPPRFRRWDGSGTVAVQIQRGLPVPLLAADRRVRIDSTRQPARIGLRRDGAHRRRELLLPRISLRVGSAGRDPIWAIWPLDVRRARALPADGLIMWAKVHRRRVAGHTRWELHLTVQEPARATRCGSGRAAVDLGWRLLQDGSVRVGYVVGGDGAEAEICVPASIMATWGAMETRQGRRSVHLDELVATTVPLVQAATATIPGLAERVETIAHWRSPSRFAALALWLRDHAPEHPVTAALEEWRSHDRHHWEREANLRRQALDRRLDLYRKAAARLATQYGEIVLESFDLRSMARRAPIESDAPENEAARRQRHLAAPSVLRQAIVNALTARGGRIVDVPAHDTTQDCNACGAHQGFDASAALVWRCTACGAQWDQDANAARNMLGRAAECGVERSGGAAHSGGLSARQTRFREAKRRALEGGDATCD